MKTTAEKSNVTEMPKKSLAAKLAHVMTQVKYIQKKGFNKFHKYNYATEADVNEAIREVLAEMNVLMLPSVVGREVREVTTRAGNVEFIVTVDMEFTFVDGDSDQQYTIRGAGEGQDSGDKGIYKAITGAQKYALMKAFMIPTGDDPELPREDEKGEDDKPPQPPKGETQPGKKPEAPDKPSTYPPPKGTVSAPQRGLISKSATEKNIAATEMLAILKEQFGIQAKTPDAGVDEAAFYNEQCKVWLDSLSSAQANTLIKHLLSLPKQ